MTLLTTHNYHKSNNDTTNMGFTPIECNKTSSTERMITNTSINTIMTLLTTHNYYDPNNDTTNIAESQDSRQLNAINILNGTNDNNIRQLT